MKEDQTGNILNYNEHQKGKENAIEVGQHEALKKPAFKTVPFNYDHLQQKEVVGLPLLKIDAQLMVRMKKLLRWCWGGLAVVGATNVSIAGYCALTAPSLNLMLCDNLDLALNVMCADAQIICLSSIFIFTASSIVGQIDHISEEQVRISHLTIFGGRINKIIKSNSCDVDIARKINVLDMKPFLTVWKDQTVTEQALNKFIDGLDPVRSNYSRNKATNVIILFCVGNLMLLSVAVYLYSYYHVEKSDPN